MSDYKINLSNIEDIDKNIKIAFISSKFNDNFVSRLEEVNEKFLVDNGFNDITKYSVPGAFEIPGLMKKIIDNHDYDIIICLGVVIRGATTHYETVAGESARALMDLSINYKGAMVYGILTCENEAQVEERICNSSAITGLNLLKSIKNV